jgi:hypothetical protein
VQGLSSLSRSQGVTGTRQHSGGLSLPPMLNATPEVRQHTYRYINKSSGTTAFTITGNKLAGAIGAIVYVANTTARSFCGTCRVKYIKVWPSMDSAVAGMVCDLRWEVGAVGYFIKDVDMVKSVPYGTTVPSCVTFSPPRRSLCGEWMALGAIGTGTLFTIEVSVGYIIDVCLDYTIVNNQTGATVPVSTTVAVGFSGYTPLDGSGGTLQPVGADKVL